MSRPLLKNGTAAVALATCVVTASGYTDSASSNAAASPDSTFLPRSIGALRAIAPGSVRYSVSVNAGSPSDARLITGDFNEFRLERDQLQEGRNQVVVEFSFPDDASGSRTLATGTDFIDYSPGLSPILFSGLHFEYEDSDGDGVYDVHGLAVTSTFDDGDGLPSVDDADSDDDGTPDGDDPEPYGPGSQYSVGALLHDFAVLDAAGTEFLIRVDKVVGGVDEIARLDDSSEPLQLRVADGWPHQMEPADLAGAGWTAFALTTEDSDGLCSSMPIAVDSSSLKSSLQKTALLFFRRPDGISSLATLAEAAIENLDVFAQDQPFGGEGPYNDALRLILVPRNTAGWMELFSGVDYQASSCSLNLTTPAVGLSG